MPYWSVGRCDVVFRDVIDQCAIVADSRASWLSFAGDILRSMSSRRRQESWTSADMKAREKPVADISTSRRARSARLGIIAMPVTAMVRGATIM